jgi:hypothetical protein
MPRGIPRSGNGTTHGGARHARPMVVRMVEMLKKASQKDIDDIDAEIAAAEARVLSLKAAREVLAQEVLNREEVPAKPLSSRDRIARFLSHAGTANAKSICEHLKVSMSGGILRCLEDPIFQKTDSGAYTLTPEGKKLAAAL